MKSLDEALREVCVVGAAGKMGRGIALLLLQDMAMQTAKQFGKTGTKEYRLILIDSNEEGFHDLKNYLKSHLRKYAEKAINTLRDNYANEVTLVSNEEIVNAFIEGAIDFIVFETNLEKAKNAHLVFEAVIEDLKTKKHLLNTLNAVCSPETYYFSNTSSIPISILEEQTRLKGRLIGFHFYNPPHIQRLMEVIFPNKNRENPSEILREFAEQLSKRLKKITVVSNDVAGFIGNGHFMREVSFALSQVDQLSKSYSQTESIYMENRVTQDFLIRPMGIFQLLDYIGLDVSQKISQIMKKYIPGEKFHTELVDAMIAEGIRGGQDANGSQKDGFFKYEKNVPIALYSLNEKQYLPIKNAQWAEKCDQLLGKLPEGHLAWKKLVQDPDKEAKLQLYFSHLGSEKSLGADLAKAFLQKSQEIAKKLVEEGTAQSMDDLDKVLENGFYHLYGPEAGYRSLRNEVLT